MEKKYKVEMADEITMVRFISKPELADIRMSIDDAAAISTSGLRLWDFSDSGLDLRTAQLEELADYAKTKFVPPSKVAIVAAKDLSFGLSRIYEAFRTQEGLEIEIFRTEQKALAWLKIKSG